MYINNRYFKLYTYDSNTNTNKLNVDGGGGGVCGDVSYACVLVF